MKIKEVIGKTGLTDKAIRLYINEGLAVPNIEENHSGRKSIEFSEDDVERLNNVAMLRKAGFSIADIKCIVDKKEIKEIIGKYIGETQTEIGYKTEIVEKLKNISFDEEVTLETICNTLSATVEETEVPSEDLNLTFREIVRKVASVIFASALLIFSVAFLVMFCMVILDVRYITFDVDSFDYMAFYFHAFWFVLIAFSIKILRMNTGKRFVKNSRGKKKGKTAVLVLISTLGWIVLTPISFLLMIFATPFCSQTTDVENYLKFDESLESEFNHIYSYSAIYDVFPRKVPRSATITSSHPYNPEVPDTTKYYYNFTVCPDGNYGTYDISAEWVLDYDDYEMAKKALPGDIVLNEALFEFSKRETDEEIKENLMNMMIENSAYKVETKGDWTIIFYRNDEIHYTYLIAAYNDKERKMRYIASDRCGHEYSPDVPYYQTFDWE